MLDVLAWPGAVLSLARSVPGLANIAELAGAPVLRVSWEPQATGDERVDRDADSSAPTRIFAAPQPSTVSFTTSTATPKIESSLIGSPNRWRWFHVEVRNSGRLPAINARGFIKKLWVLKDGDYSVHPDWVGLMRLHWANRGEEALTIHRMREGPWDRLDLFRVGNTPGPLVLVTPTPDHGLPTQLPRGSYRLLVMVESRSTPRPEECALSVDFGGNWDSVSVLQIPLDLVRAGR